MDYIDKSKEELIKELRELKRDYDSLKKMYDILSLDCNYNEDTILNSMGSYYHAFEYSAVGIWFVDTTGRFIKCNKAIQQLLGYTNEELKSLTFNDITHPDDLFIGNAYLAKLLSNEIETASFEKRYIRKNGQIIYALTNVSLIREDNNPRFFITQINDITVRKQATDKLESSLSLLNATLESTADGILVIDSNGKVTQFNQKFAEMWQMPEQLLEKKIDEKLLNYVITKLSNPEEFISKVKQLYEQPDESSFDNFNLLDGRIFERYSQPQKIGNNIVGRVWSFRDITERKKTEETLLETQLRYRATVEQSNDGITIADINGRYTMVNAAFCKMTGYTEEELLIMTVFDLLPKEEHQMLFSKVAEQGAQEVKGTREMELMRKDGSLFFASISATSLLIKNNRYVQGIVRDITERNRSVDALKNSEEKFRKAFYTNPDSIVISRLKDGMIVSINKGFTQIMEYTEEEVKGKTAGELNIWSNPEDREKLKQGLITDGFVENFEALFCSKSGELGYGLMSAAIIEFDGEPHIINITRDIRARKKIEEELIKAKEKAEESDRLKTSFLQNMSHELRTPMNAIMGFSSLLPKNFNNKAKLEQFTKLIIQRSGDLLEIINDLLDTAKIESGQLSVYFDECNLNSLFTDLAYFFKENQTRYERQHINLKTHVHINQTETIILTDKVKLNQIFINLISNALKFTDSGEIIIGCKCNESNKLVFYVSDTGIGIPADKHEKIFERFAQLNHGPNRLYGGTGLGLSIVKGIVNLLGGEIWLESEPNKGSTFYFTLAYKTIQPEKLEEYLFAESNEYRFPGKTILIVEDDIYNAEFLNEMLANTGTNILNALFGEVAVQIALTQPIDLILMDVRLPDMTGYDVTQQIRKEMPNLKIIAQTAFASPSERKKALDAGCCDFISKPINPDLLLSMLNKHLS